MGNAAERVAAALALHQRGDVARAEASYREILKDHPQEAEAMHLLGLIAGEAGRTGEAQALIAAAIREKGAEPVWCANLGAAFLRDGKPREAAVCFLQSLEAGPSNGATWARLGEALARLGAGEEARAAFERAVALVPHDADSHFALARLLENKDPDEAGQHFREAAAFAPLSFRYQFELGNHLSRRHLWREAAECYREAARLDPDNAQAVYNLGVACAALGDTAAAAEAYARAVDRDPPYPPAYNNLGTILQESGKLPEACRCYRAALQLDPDYHDALYNLGLALQESGDEAGAAGVYRRVLERVPGHAEARNNLGNVLLELGDPRAALACYDAVAEQQPGHAEAQWNAGVTRLLLGDFRRGWEGYEWRLKQREAPRREFPAPGWNGEEIRGRTLLVHTEQGLGDAIQFIRYAALAARAGARVLVECQPSLAALLGTAPGVSAVVPRGSGLPAFDFHVPLMSLPRIFGTTLETVPCEIPYLSAGAIPEEPGRLLAPGGGLRAGLVWAGNPNHKNDRYRSMAAAELEPLAAVPGVRLFSLQKGQSAPPTLPAVPLDAWMSDWSATAAMVSNLDLVISVDTAVAHLAGALGVKVWTLLPYPAEWRWRVEGETTPWYPSMRLFRQAERKDWGAVVRRVAGELRELAERAP